MVFNPIFADVWTDKSDGKTLEASLSTNESSMRAEEPLGWCLDELHSALANELVDDDDGQAEIACAMAIPA